VTDAVMRSANPKHKRSATVPSLLVGVSLMLATGCGSSTAHVNSAVRGRPAASRSPYASYPALSIPGPSGIEIVPHARAHIAASTGFGPLWVEESGGNPRIVTPEISSAREVAHRHRARFWISRNRMGGVCVLSFHPELANNVVHYHSVTASCGTATSLTKGAVLFEREPRGAWLVVGVAPNNVVRVSLRLSDGTTRTTSVEHDSYLITVPEQVHALSLIGAGTGAGSSTTTF
jgi:hypothetical protein